MATDEEIQQIIDENEAGVDDLIEAYRPVEEQYFAVVQQPASGVTIAVSNTSQR